MADQLFIGIDSGTQGTKVVVVSEQKRKIIAEGYAAHRLTEGPYGKREQEPQWCLHTGPEHCAENKWRQYERG